MTTVSPASGLPPLAPDWSRQAMQGSLRLMGGRGQGGFSVPESAYALAPGVPAARVARDWKTAERFAEMAIGELLQPIFDTVHLSKSRFGGGAGEAAWKPIFVQAIGAGIAREGGLGITETVFRALQSRQEAAAQAAPAAMKSPDGQSPDGQSSVQGGTE